MASFLHDDGLCSRNSADAEGLVEATRQFARISDALGLPDTGHSFQEITEAALTRLAAQSSAADGHGARPANRAGAAPGASR